MHSPLKIVTVIGARPQFIKAAVVSAAIRRSSKLSEVLVHTGQHFDANMSDIFFQELGLRPPQYHLGISSGTHGAQTGQMLSATEEVLLQERPDWVLVYGDTNSTLAGALAAAKLHVPVAHVEAGLRSFNRKMPEEINRVLTDHLAGQLFAPTENAVANLRREGIAESQIQLVGDVMYDACLGFRTEALARTQTLAELALVPRQYVLATIHRAENTDDRARLLDIFTGFGRVAQTIPVVVPLHPRTRKSLAAAGWENPAPEALRLIDPVGYLDMLGLESQARLIVTDSGGVQKEAFFNRVPCVTLRTETEWTELVEIGWNRLAPPDSPVAVSAAILSALAAPLPPEPATELYGGGSAAERIVRCFE